MEHIPSAEEWNAFAIESNSASLTAGRLDLEEQRARWTAKAPSYAHKRVRGGYLDQMMQCLRMQPGESAFDMGCGPGVITVPLAQAGHHVVAVDFSDGMLAELRAAVDAVGVQDQVQVFRRAWQENWDDLPCADVVFSSRSLTWSNFAEAVAKLESKARKRVVISGAAGETPWCDLRLLHAMGRTENEVDLSKSFVVLLNYLLMSGRMPRVEYIGDRRRSNSDSEEELRNFLTGAAQPETPHEEAAVKAWLDEHIEPRPGGGVQLDYEQITHWGVITWDVVR